MNNVVNLQPSPKGGPKRPTPVEVDAAIEHAKKLLSDTFQSLYDSSGRVDLCHLAAVEKVKQLLSLASEAERSGAMAALSMTELARLSIVAGEDTFQGGTILDYGCSIGRALEAALAYLDGRLADDDDA